MSLTSVWLSNVTVSSSLPSCSLNSSRSSTFWEAVVRSTPDAWRVRNLSEMSSTSVMDASGSLTCTYCVPSKRSVVATALAWENRGKQHRISKTTDKIICKLSSLFWRYKVRNCWVGNVVCELEVLAPWSREYVPLVLPDMAEPLLHALLPLWSHMMDGALLSTAGNNRSTTGWATCGK